MKNTNLLWASASLCIVLQTASAEERVINFSIPPQPAATALDALATQSDLQMLFNRDALKNSTTQGLTGRFTARDALKKLLLGTGLTYTFTADDAVAVKPAPEQLNKADPTTLKPVNVTAKANRDVTDPYNQDYVLPNATAGTKTDTPIMETPLNVQVISKQVMKDQQITSLAQALKNVSGVTTDNFWTLQSTNQSITLRGFASESYFRNGFRLQEGAGQREMANVESVEVLKGSAAILYGLVEPGGMVNVITKQPLATPYYSLNQQFGSYNFYRTTVDATGPLTKDDTLLYRINMSYENSGSYRELVQNQKVFVAPIVKWNISSKTQATFELEYSNDNLGLDTPFAPMFNRQFIKIPTNRNYGEAATGKHENIFGGFNWSHQFTDDWSVKHSVSVNQQTTNRLSVVPLPLWLSPLYGFPADQVPRALYQYNNKYNTYATNIDLIGHFYTGILKHTLLLGGDYYRKDLYLDNGLNVAASYVDINYPIHTGTNGGMTLDPASAYTSSQYSDQYGIYLQDQIKLPYHFNVTGGLRYQYIHQSSAQVDSTGTVNQFPSLTADAVTPRVGLLWQPQNWLSLYSNYTENFGANQGTVFPNQAAAPSSAQQWEVGAKTEFFDGRLRATLAYFDLTKTNVPSVDPNPAHSGFSLLTGEVRSRGPELDIQGEILPGWNVIATYANTDIIVTKAGDGDYPAVGSRYYGVPRNTASLWNTYDFQQEHLKGFKVGGGVTLRDGQVANTTSAANAPAFTIPGYGTVDLLAAYSQNVGKTRVTAQLNINNLLDKYYYTSATFLSSPSTTGYDGGFVNFGAPRTVMGSIRIEY